MENIFFMYNAENHQLALPALILFLIVFGMFIRDKLVKNKVFLRYSCSFCLCFHIHILCLMVFSNAI